MTETQIIISLLTSVLILCVTIVIIYFWIKLSKISHLIVVKKRYMTLIHIELTLAIIYLLLERFLYTIETLTNSKDAVSIAIQWTHLIIYPFTFHGVLLLILLRIYHMYYDLNYNQISESSKWKTILNPALKLHKNWFIQNKYKYGSWLYTLKYIVFPVWIIDSLCGCVIYIGIQNFDLAGIAILFYEFPYHIISNILIWLIYRKIPTHYDAIYMKIEFRQTCIAYTSFFVVIGSAYVVLLFFNVDRYTRRMVDIILYVFGVIALTSPTIITIPAKIEKEFGAICVEKPDVVSRSVTDLFRSKSVNRSVSASNSVRDVDINQIFKNEQGFNQFMVQLQREMCMECLLCFVELIQFKIGINNINNTNAESPLNIAIIDCFYAELPRSGIVSKDLDKLQEMDDLVILTLFTQKYTQLYNKYIKNGSELEINISYNERRKQFMMITSFNVANVNITMNDLKQGFDGVIMELYQLMNDPFSRFKQTSKYDDLCVIMNDIK